MYAIAFDALFPSSAFLNKNSGDELPTDKTTNKKKGWEELQTTWQKIDIPWQKPQLHHRPSAHAQNTCKIHSLIRNFQELPWFSCVWCHTQLFVPLAKTMRLNQSILCCTQAPRRYIRMLNIFSGCFFLFLYAYTVICVRKSVLTSLNHEEGLRLFLPALAFLSRAWSCTLHSYVLLEFEH